MRYFPLGTDRHEVAGDGTEWVEAGGDGVDVNANQVFLSSAAIPDAEA